MTKISVIGSGQVGSRVGKKFASLGNDVLFFDVFEGSLKGLTEEGFNTTMDFGEAIGKTDVSFVAVPTPFVESGFDFSFVESAAKSMGEALKNKNEYHVFILKSTITPGTTRKVFLKTLEESSGKIHGTDFGIVYNPEFLTVIEDTWTDDDKFKITPDKEGRIVLGVEDDKSFETVKNLYEQLGVPIFRTNFETAEATKMVANTRLPLVVSFTNEVTESLRKANEALGIEIDVDKVVELVHMDTRIGLFGSVFGKAYGGPCFKKDPPAFVKFFENSIGSAPSLIKHTVEVNNKMSEKYGVRE